MILQDLEEIKKVSLLRKSWIVTVESEQCWLCPVCTQLKEEPIEFDLIFYQLGLDLRVKRFTEGDLWSCWENIFVRSIFIPIYDFVLLHRAKACFRGFLIITAPLMLVVYELLKWGNISFLLVRGIILIFWAGKVETFFWIIQNTVGVIWFRVFHALNKRVCTEDIHTEVERWPLADFWNCSDIAAKFGANLLANG